MKRIFAISILLYIYIAIYILTLDILKIVTTNLIKQYLLAILLIIKRFN